MFQSKVKKSNLILANKNGIPIILIVILILSIHLPKSYAQNSIKFAGVDTLVDQAIEILYQKKYFDAITTCEQVIKQYPDNPLGYLGQAAVYHIIMLNYRVSLFDSQFEKSIQLI